MMAKFVITKPYTAKSRPIIFNGEMVRAILDGRKTQTRRIIKVEWLRCLDLDEPEDLQKAIEQCPYGIPGDFLWVRETFHLDIFPGQEYIYRADDPKIEREWKPSIFMPRWASRITLKIIDIRVERVQDINSEDIQAEGISQYTRAKGVLSDNPPDPRWKFIELWDSINAKRGYSWESNPWVWIIEFERIEDE